VNFDRTETICRSLADAGNVTFDCQTRLNCLADKRLPRLLYEGGCRWVEIGLESASTNTQAVFKQHTRLSEVEVTLARLRDEGLPACSYLVVGLPNETISDMQRTLDWACDLISRDLLYASYISVCVPYPGSPMYSHPENYGMRLHHSDFALYNEELPPVFDTPLASSESVYDVFISGVGMLAKEMGRRPALTFGDAFPPASFGNFYRGADPTMMPVSGRTEESSLA
jgi:radical SAM superfamily enzyme YgiQ (UPF0313 family)